MSRKLEKDILSEWVAYTNETEVPDIFAVWVAMATIAACLGRSVWVDMGHLTFYPNLYVLLVAGSARCRKSTAINMGKKILSKVKPTVMTYSQKMSPEAFIKRLSCIDMISETKIGPTAEGIIIADELSTLVDRRAFESGLIALLTSLWDNHDEWTYETIKHGQLVIPQSCVSFLAGSTETWIKTSIPVESIGGGFTSRVIFVYRGRPDRFVPVPVTSKENKERYDNIIHDLGVVRLLRGRYELTTDAMEIWRKEYVKWFREAELKMDSRLSGYIGRRMDLVMKVSIIVAASIRDERVITRTDILIAIGWMKETEKTMTKVMNAITTGAVGEMIKEVMYYIRQWDKPGQACSRVRLMQQLSHRMTARDLDFCIETLEASGQVQECIEGRKRYYKYLGEQSFTDKIIAKGPK